VDIVGGRVVAAGENFRAADGNVEFFPELPQTVEVHVQQGLF
jgi:hypothetical protein